MNDTCNCCLDPRRTDLNIAGICTTCVWVQSGEPKEQPAPLMSMPPRIDWSKVHTIWDLICPGTP